MTGLEPATSAFRTQHSKPTELHSVSPLLYTTEQNLEEENKDNLATALDLYYNKPLIHQTRLYSLMDRTKVSGTFDVGPIPTGGTTSDFFTIHSLAPISNRNPLLSIVFDNIYTYHPQVN